MTATDAERRQALPASPFFRPSVAIRVTERGIHTPRGQHRRKHNLVKPKVEEHKSGLLGCAANMGVAIVGSGIVGLPYAIKQAGFVAGVCLIVLTAVLTEKSLRLLVETAKHLHKQSYETAAEVPFGVAGFRFVLINMFIMSYGAMVTYLMITKDCASLLLSVTDKNTQQLVLLAVSLTIQLPLACLRDMADLEKTSALAVLIDVVIVALVAYSSPWIEGVREHGGWLELVKNDTVHYSSIFVGLGVLSFAFECQESAFLVAGSLDRPTAKRWGTVTSFTLAFCALLALVCGITGYFGYFDHAKGNILNNLDPSLSTTVAAQAMLGVTMLARIPWRRSWPVTCYQAHRGDVSAILNRLDRRVLLTTALYVLSMIPATILTDMGKVLALAGVVGASCLAYIGPGMLYLAVHGGRFLDIVDAWFFRIHPENCNSNAPVDETTPLVHQSKNITEKQSREEKRIDGFFKTLIWYLGGFPLWCRIAELGKKRVLAHAQELAAKDTINQLRIGDVDPCGIEILLHRDSKEELSSLVRLHSDNGSETANEVTFFNKQGVVLKKQETPNQLQVPMLEADPQANPPAWSNFLIALFYIIFGCLALVAGLISLMDNSESDDSSPRKVVTKIHS